MQVEIISVIIGKSHTASVLLQFSVIILCIHITIDAFLLRGGTGAQHPLPALPAPRRFDPQQAATALGGWLGRCITGFCSDPGMLRCGVRWWGINHHTS